MSKLPFDAHNIHEEGCVIIPEENDKNQTEAARKQFEWLARSMPQTAVGEAVESDSVPNGIALSPHDRGCGRSYPMQGTNYEDLTAWCIEHEV